MLSPRRHPPVFMNFKLFGFLAVYASAVALRFLFAAFTFLLVAACLLLVAAILLLLTSVAFGLACRGLRACLLLVTSVA